MDVTGPALKMARAKTSLILKNPFYATLACNMPWVESTDIPTMATDGDTVWWNPEFVNSMTLDETKFVICHEIMHCVFEHMGRRGQRDPLKWNIATDYVINDLLVREGIGTMPKMGLLDHDLAQRGKYLADIVYSLLPDPPKEPKGGKGYDGKGGQPLDEVRDRKGSDAEKSAKANIMKVRVAQAAQAAKMCGSLSANLQRIVGEVLQPKVDWREVLRNFVSVRAKIDHTYARPKRRWLGEDIILPSLTGLQMGTLAVAVDCSGSIGPRELAEFAAEIRAIVADAHPARLDVIYFDSSVSHHDTYMLGDEPHIVGHGGGGTAFSPIFAHIAKAGIEPVATVVLTDLYCSDFGPAPEYPVLWVTTGDDKAPWGQIVKMK